ncbi:reverse transcriptase domain-containing protein, partial [Tanacetum coccineum]
VDHSKPNRRFAARGNGYEERDPRDAKIERLRQRVRELETKSSDKYNERVDNMATNSVVDEHKDTNNGYDNLFARRHYRQHQPPHGQHIPHTRQPQQPNQRYRDDKHKVDMWDKMKRLLRDKFLPVTYKQDAYLDYQNLKQGSLSIEELISEFERMRMRCGAEEDEEQIIARFLGILRPKITNIVSLQKYYSFSDVCQLALRVERQLAQKSKTFSKFPAYPRTPTAGPTNTRIGLIKVDPLVIPTTQTGTSNAIWCFKCQGLCHLKRDCPNKQILAFVDDTESKYDTEEGEAPEVLYPDRGEVLLSRMLLSTVLADPEDDTKWLRNNIFRTKYTKKGKVCMVIIDGRSCENMVAITMVEKLSLPI